MEQRKVQLDEVLKEGTMFKLSKRIIGEPKWKSFYFKLRYQSLSYFADSKSSKLKGKIFLGGASINTYLECRCAYPFEISNQKEEKSIIWKLSCNKEDEREDWMSWIQMVTQYTPPISDTEASQRNLENSKHVSSSDEDSAEVFEGGLSLTRDTYEEKRTPLVSRVIDRKDSVKDSIQN